MIHLQFTSFPKLKTERLILRARTKPDTITLSTIRSNEEVMPYIDRESPKNLEETEVKIKLMQDGFDNKTSMAWVIALKEKPNEMIG